MKDFMAYVNGGWCFDQSSWYDGYVLVTWVIAEETHHQSPQNLGVEGPESWGIAT